MASISHWENDKKQPRPSKKRKLAEVFNCTVKELFPSSEPPVVPSSSSEFPDWFAQAWQNRFVFALYGWFDLSKLRKNLSMDLDLKDCLVIDTPLELIIVPTNDVETAPLLLRQNEQGEWQETHEFFEFEQHMSVILNRKRVLRNDIAYYPHEKGIALQPAVGKEHRFTQITEQLMDDLPNYRRETIDLVFR